MKLLELYSLATGLRIGKQSLVETFYPIEVSRYITLQASSGMAAKNYPHYNEVMALIRDALAAADIRVVQLGGKDDQPIVGAIHLQGKTTLHQSNYLVKRALVHVGNDSWLAHRAGALKVPLVCVYGPTTVANHSPYEFDADHTVLIESHRFGRNPTFASQESPATIAVIPPEQIAAAILRLLAIPDVISHKTAYIGPDYPTVEFSIVPNMVPHPQMQLGVPILRMDLEFNEQVMAQNLQVRKCVVVTDREIAPNLLAQLRPQIALLRIWVDALTPQWVKTVKRLGIPIQALSRETDEVKLRNLRLSLFDVDCFFDVVKEPTADDLRREIAVYRNSELDTLLNIASLRFKTNRFLLSSGKIHLSIPHWRAGRSVESTEQNTDSVIDSAEFWGQQRTQYFFTP